MFRRDEAEYLIEAENPSPMPGFAEQLIGMECGDQRDFDLIVPSEESWGALAGQTVSFHAEVLDVKEKELPALDDVFAESLGHTDLAEMRKYVENQLREGAEGTARRTAQQEVLDEALLFCMVKVPQKLVELSAARAYERLAGDLDMRGLSIEQYLQARSMAEEALRAELSADAERTLKRRFVLQRIATDEGLQVSDEEVDAEIRTLLSYTNATNRSAAETWKGARARNGVRSSLLENRAVEWLFQIATGQEPPPADRPSEPEGEPSP